jgi:cell division protein FtsZ
MTLNLTMPDQPDLKPRITVFGVGGAGGNAVNNMIDQELDGCEFVVANTDAQALAQSKAHARIQMGAKVTEGLGAGARPAVGASAAEESIETIVDHLVGAHMCFITAGMGGGTGTGAAPIIAQAARELGVLTVGVVTKPFQFEGAKRMRQADDGIEALQKVVDTLIIIPNQNLFRLANEKTTFTEAFAMADDVLYQGVKGVTDLMVRPGLINLDFADVRAVMNEMGKAMMGTGESEGEDRAIQAAERAIANPLLDEISLKGARGVLINITGGYDLTLFELDEAANRIREEVDPEANIIVGSTLDTDMEGKIRVSVVATGIDAAEVVQDIPAPMRRLHTQSVAASGHHGAAAAVKAAPLVASEPVYEEEEEQAPIAAEPSLFNRFDAATAHEQAEDLFEEEDGAVPAPAYQPRAEAPAPTHEPVRRAEPDAYVAPRANTGHPTPETLQRLRDVIAKDRPGARPVEQPAEETRGRFGGGIGSLIGRMTGHGEDSPVAPQRRQPPVQSRAHHDDEQVDPEQDRIEIPAFLRRQAN